MNLNATEQLICSFQKLITFKSCSYMPVVVCHQASIPFSSIHSLQLQNYVPTVVKLTSPEVIRLEKTSIFHDTVTSCAVTFLLS